jgi:sugar transferase (PEP-CTERM system associated)
MLRIFRHYVPLPALALSILELTFILAAFYISYSATGFDRSAVDAATRFYIAAFSALLVITAMFSLGLYNRSIFSNYRDMLLRSTLSMIVTLPVLLLTHSVVAFYWGAPYEFENTSLLPPVIIALIAVAGTRLIVLPTISIEALRRRVLVIGVGELAERIEQLARTTDPAAFVVVRFVRLNAETPRVRAAYIEQNQLIDGNTLAGLAEANYVDEIVIATRDRRGLPIDDLLDCKLQGVQIVEYLSFWEREKGQIDLDALQPSWLFFSDGVRMSWFVNSVKRSFDVAISLLFLTITAPVIAATAVAIRFEGKGPVFYVQERVGLHGRPFALMKFRSMSVNAETEGPRWATVNDQRITRIGAFIRKTRIDEIPQVINVLRGDMSFIGPRPERPFFVETLAQEIPYYAERHRVKPGISGWAQINYPYGASVEDARQKLTYDLYYVKNRSLFLDMLILLQTARVVLWPEGVR